MVEIGVVGGGEALQKVVAEVKAFQSQRADVHRTERSKVLEKGTGTPLLGQKISGLGQSLDTFA